MVNSWRIAVLKICTCEKACAMVMFFFIKKRDVKMKKPYINFVLVLVCFLSQIEGVSSISDREDHLIYKIDVEKSIDSKFENFRRLPGICQIYEHVSKGQAATFYRSILKKYKFLLKGKIFEGNDKIGNPAGKKKYKYLGKIAPTTMRYIHILGEIVNLFDLKDGCKIVELGCGYGGQCSVISSYIKFSDYRLIDLEFTHPLIERYLDTFGCKNYTCEGQKFVLKDEYDLFISNYGISEVYKEFQDVYIRNVISKCKRGYVIYNQLSKGMAYDANEFCEKLRQYGLRPQIKKETISTSPKNVLICWGHD